MQKASAPDSASARTKQSDASPLADEDLRRVGVAPELILLSVGLEHIDDIIAELDRALETI